MNGTDNDDSDYSAQSYSSLSDFSNDVDEAVWGWSSDSYTGKDEDEEKK
jgi:hypothetical protein